MNKNKSAIVTRRRFSQLDKYHIAVLVLGPYLSGEHNAILRDKRNQVKKYFNSDQMKNVSADMPEDDELANIIKEGGNWLNAVVEDFAPHADLILILYGKKAGGTQQEISELANHPQYGPKCYIVYDEDQYIEDKIICSDGGSTYSAILDRLSEKAYNKNYPLVVRGLPREEIKACRLLSNIEDLIRQQRLFLMRKK